MTPAPPISLLPESLNLQLYGGDGVELRLTVTNTIGDPVALTGEIDAQIRTTRTNNVQSTSFAADLTDGASGIVILSLTGDQTASLHGDPQNPAERFTGVWDVQWTPQGGQPVTIVQGSVESNLDVTRLQSALLPILDSISPASMLTTDPATTLTCTGSNFGASPTIEISTDSGSTWIAQFTTDLDDTQCNIQYTPPGTAGTVLVRVTTSNGSSGTQSLTIS